ncbi:MULTISPECIES: tyrosine-type recombinase/integrase [unclassified Microbacterium]|uniref:tyrosine-type recombinase/integrase n=1 Tax=unclassified Microbacterium TaxID=2609290 RepID=UPI00109B87BB|nr:MULTISPECIES: site-specific integrase [unclassified Microbacterium]
MDDPPLTASTRRWRQFKQVRTEGGTDSDAEDMIARLLQRALPHIPVGTPYLVSPDFEYDAELNDFFHSANMLGSRMSTRVGYASNLAAFLNFLHVNRGGKNWRDATPEDHEAYFGWRREDPDGPRVGASTWDREVAAVNRYYAWQVARGSILENPIPQRQRRAFRQRAGHLLDGGTAPATRSHGARRDRLDWLPSSSYRRWRDIGLRGYRPDGQRDQEFRGRWATRNATFADMLVRTGLRLAEQASLFTFELPAVARASGYHRYFLPASVAKGGSSRWIYIPSSVLRSLHEYVETDRSEALERFRDSGGHRIPPDSFILDADRRHARAVGSGHRIGTNLLTPEERRRTFVDRGDALEPALLWLSESGDPMSVSSWKHIFSQANARCARNRVALHASAHTLRHSFAVITLEHLQRGHIAALRSLNLDQRGEYVRVFGDPLDWVRRRLGHRSIETTQIYLHTLADLEMTTRMKLIPDEWEDSSNPVLIAQENA